MGFRVRWSIVALPVLILTAVVFAPLGRARALGAATLTTLSNAVCQFSDAFVGPWSNAGRIRNAAMAVDNQGNMIVAGSFSGRMNFGGSEIVSRGGVDIFIARYSSNGAHLWSQGIGGTRDDWAKAVAVDSTGNIFITSWSASGTVDFGAGSITIVSGYLAKYSPDGANLWARMLGTNSGDGTALQTDSSGNIIVGGCFSGPSDFGGGPIASHVGGDLFLAKYSPAGGYLWAFRAGGSTAYGNMLSQVAVDHANNVVMTGYTTGAGDMGGVSFPGFGGRDIFLVKYGSAGSPLWSRSYGGSGADSGKGIAIDSVNDIVMTGSLTGDVDLGNGLLAGGGVFLSKYSPSGGAVWSENYPTICASVENGNAVATAGGDNIVITGAVVGDINLGGGTLPMLPGDGNNNTYVAEYSSTGSHMWSVRFANLIPADSPAFNGGKAIGTDSGGNVIVSGLFSDSIDLGAGVLTNPGACGGACGYGGYLVKFVSSSTTPTSTPTAVPATATPTRTPTPAGATATPTPSPTSPAPTATPTRTPTNMPTATPAPTSGYFTLPPCRQYDSRNSTPLLDNTNRSVTLIGAPCGVPADARAVSANITVFNITGAGGNGAFQVGTTANGTLGWMNYPPREVQRGNAGFLPLNGAGQIVVKVTQGGGMVDFTVDVNGYFR